MMANYFQDTLQLNSIQLRRFTQADYTPLMALALSDVSMWRFLQPSSESLESFVSGYFEAMLRDDESGDIPCYVIVNTETGQFCGSSRFYDISLSDKRLAIGFTWLHPSVWGSGVNPAAKYLLLRYAFETLAMNRVEFHVDARNMRSLAAMKKLGAMEDGILRRHKIVQGDFVRDTVLLSVVDSDWPEVKDKLVARLV